MRLSVTAGSTPLLPRPAGSGTTIRTGGREGTCRAREGGGEEVTIRTALFLGSRTDWRGSFIVEIYRVDDLQSLIVNLSQSFLHVSSGPSAIGTTKYYKSRERARALGSSNIHSSFKLQATLRCIPFNYCARRLLHLALDELLERLAVLGELVAGEIVSDGTVDVRWMHLTFLTPSWSLSNAIESYESSSARVVLRTEEGGSHLEEGPSESRLVVDVGNLGLGVGLDGYSVVIRVSVGCYQRQTGEGTHQVRGRGCGGGARCSRRAWRGGQAQW